MISNLIFDMGRVLIDWSPEQLTAGFDLVPEDRALLIREVFSWEWHAVDRGTMTPEEELERVSARLPERLHPWAAKLVLGWWDLFFCPIPGMEALLRELKAQGYGLYVLSNAAHSFRTYFPRIPGSDCFDGTYVSAEHLLMKPQHEIYEDCFRLFDLDPATCFFIDDSAANIEGAHQVGLAGTVFHGDVRRLRRELRALGVRCQAED